MILQEIPLIAGSADQRVDVTLDNVPYTLRVMWNERFQYWSLSIYYRDGAAILLNIKMVNNYPLVGRFARLNMKGDLYFLNRAGLSYPPGFDDVGCQYGLFYYDPETTTAPVPIAPRT